MAVKASVTITISKYRDTDSITRYYKLQASTAAAPAVPTTLTPSGWSTSEPTYTSGSTNTLYYTDCIVFSDGAFQYTDDGNGKAVKSSSYEAAKEAYNKAQAAQDSIDNLNIGGRNYILRSSEEYTLSIPQGTNKYAFRALNISDALIELDETIKTFTISFDAYSQNGGTHLQGYLRGTTASPMDSAPDSGISTTEWKRYSITKTIKNGYTVKNIVNFYLKIEGDSTDTVYFKNIKVEVGNKPTDWTPAPEDIESDILDLNDIISTSRYILLTSQPVDWATNFTDYYEIIDNHYVKITGDTAPTWVENTYYKLEEALINRIRTAEQTIDSIHGIITSMVIGADGDYISTNNDGGSFTMNFGNLISKVKELVGQSNNYADKDIINEILYGNDTSEGLIDKVASNANKTAYIKAEKINGFPVITLGADESPFKVQITNTSIDFLENNQKIAFANGQAFYNLKTVVQQDVRIGGTYNETTSQVEGYGFIWKTRENGNLGLTWVDTTPTNNS